LESLYSHFLHREWEMLHFFPCSHTFILLFYIPFLITLLSFSLKKPHNQKTPLMPHLYFMFLMKTMVSWFHPRKSEKRPTMGLWTLRLVPVMTGEGFNVQNYIILPTSLYLNL
jgi:hypothetical protein